MWHLAESLPLPCEKAEAIFVNRQHERFLIRVPKDEYPRKPRRNFIAAAAALFGGWRDCRMPRALAVRVKTQELGNGVGGEIEVEFEGGIFMHLYHTRPATAWVDVCYDCGGFDNSHQVRHGTPKPGVVHRLVP